MTRQIPIPLFQRGGLRDYGECARRLRQLGSQVVLITDETVAHLHGADFCAKLAAYDVPIRLICIPPGEQTKTRAMKEQLEDALFADHLGRDGVLIAMGGGVITDLVGFVASTYCRGIALVLIPTTLLAMCDAAIGGKTGVNGPGGKNRIGTFYPADGIWVDSEMLNTLPMPHLQEGMVEMIKHGLIRDGATYAFLEQYLEKILALDPDYVDAAVQQSIAIKQQIVAEDLEDTGVRASLNFGHTIGHALEAESGYAISHGRAVAVGLKVEARLSEMYAGFPQQEVARLDRLLERLGISQVEMQVDTRDLGFSRLIAAMKGDKKNRQGTVHCVLLEAVGAVKRCGLLFTHPLSSQQFEVGMQSFLECCNCSKSVG